MQLPSLGRLSCLHAALQPSRCGRRPAVRSPSLLAGKPSAQHGQRAQHWDSTAHMLRHHSSEVLRLSIVRYMSVSCEGRKLVGLPGVRTLESPTPDAADPRPKPAECHVVIEGAPARSGGCRHRSWPGGAMQAKLGSCSRGGPPSGRLQRRPLQRRAQRLSGKLDPSRW